METEIVAASRSFFRDVIEPVLKAQFPEVYAQTAFGIFGYGSECLGMDDEISRDHHWGLRVDALMPDAVFRREAQTIKDALAEAVPDSYAGFSLREGHVAGPGLAPDSLEAFLKRTIGITRAPATNVEWLEMPEEDIVHVTNGEVWQDISGQFTVLRASLTYYPDPVWLRRISHWCRYLSGMGVYALNRALVRDNIQYATTTFARSIKWALELGFMLNRTYFPYDKWLYPFFKDLPTLADRMVPLVDEGIGPESTWPRRLEVLEEISDILDARMVEMEIIPPHPRFAGTHTSGYRLLEHAYAAIVQQLPEDVKHHVPRWDQTFLEEFHTGYVDGLDLDDWDEILNLRPTD